MHTATKTPSTSSTTSKPPAEVQTISDREKSIRRRMRDDFPLYAEKNLWIRTKEGQVSRLRLNRAQRYIHERLEEQYKKTGMVRAVILKGRQQGCSTYIEARYYHKVTHRKGVRAFILTHEDDATKNLFEMAERFYENSNQILRPHLGVSNAKELQFDLLDSGYRVGTAHTKGKGRSQTVQYFHGSEVAYWPNAEEHAKGIMQAIPDVPDTEIVLESTAWGLSNYFHQRWKQAESGQSEYIAIFVPWFWQEEYTKPVPKGFVRTDEESALAEKYGLTDGQLQWRRWKIVDLSSGGADGEAAFKQEYPCNAAEAFQTTGRVGLITPEVVLKARGEKTNGSGAYIVGVDPSRGGDRFATIKRQSRKAWGLKSYTGEECNTLGKAVAICVDLLDTVDPVAGKVPDKMFVDAGGGADLVDRLRELGYGKRVKAVAFGGTPLKTKRYKKKRSEMWGEMNLWLKDEDLPAEIPDSDSLQADLCASPYDRDSNDRIVLWKKERIVKEYGFSPDEGDALALTFAEPVVARAQLNKPPPRRPEPNGWMST